VIFDPEDSETGSKRRDFGPKLVQNFLAFSDRGLGGFLRETGITRAVEPIPSMSTGQTRSATLELAQPSLRIPTIRVSDIA